MHEENLAECRSKHFSCHADVVVVFEEHGKEWAGFVLYDQDENECFLLCGGRNWSRYSTATVPSGGKNCNPDDFQRN